MNTQEQHPPCPLCSTNKIQHFHRDKYREYLICPVCDLVFAHPDSWLSQDEEFKRYEFHENDVLDPGYRKFLQKLWTPMLERITPGSYGLDFGSGPGPLLKMMFEEQGHVMSIYDFFYASDLDVFNIEYDFITASEVLEHLHKPIEELDRLWSVLKRDGYMGIMTSMRDDEVNFAKWHYIKDETHVIFFSPKTMNWLADRWGATLEILGPSVSIFQKTMVTSPSTDSNPRMPGKELI